MRSERRKTKEGDVGVVHNAYGGPPIRANSSINGYVFKICATLVRIDASVQSSGRARSAFATIRS
jgi:hypothetical protein